MRKLFKSASVGAALFAGVALAAHAAQPVDAGPTATQIAALPSAGQVSAAIELPPVTVTPPESLSYSTPGFGPKAGPRNAVKVPHFQVWAGYDATIALHPYTSAEAQGPCPEGGGNSRADCPNLIKSSKYEQAPFTD